MEDFLLDKFKRRLTRLGQGSQFSNQINPTSYFQYMRNAINPRLIGSDLKNGFNPDLKLPGDFPILDYAILTESSNDSTPIALLSEDGNILII